MTLSTGTALLLCAIAFAVGSLPIIDWLVRGLTQQRLAELGTGNLSVSAAFYHGGTKLGLLAVASEAAKGIGVVLLARSLFANSAPWELIALIALVLGRYTLGGSAGTTNVVWGYITHDWVIALATWVLSGLWFAIVRRRQPARLGVLVLLPLLEALRRPESPATIVAATGLSLLIAAIYQRLPDDLALTPSQPESDTRPMFRFLRGQDVIGSLNDKPQTAQMGNKAATLAQLKQWGYAVPRGWILPQGSSGPALVTHLKAVEPDPWQHSWIVRSSALDEDGEFVSGAGQYESIADVRSATDLAQAIDHCRQYYDQAAAAQYRRDRGLTDQTGLALLVQQQVPGLYSGVAFSRDPVEPGAAVVVEALAGGADQVVSGQVTPEQYRLEVDDAQLSEVSPSDLAKLEAAPAATSENGGTSGESAANPIPPALIQQVAQLARHLELRYHGIPQDIEWSFDGETLWLLQARPITTLSPLWTRKIAAEVIPGVIRPLTWSINRPLTCGVWGDIFTIVLGDRAAGLDFGNTATLHYSRAYFNATLLGATFRRMGLPPESLEFLTLGSKFSKPPIGSTLQNVPGLLRLLRREWRLLQDFEQDDRQHFAPVLTHLRATPATTLAAPELLTRIDTILQQLQRATYYNILGPLSFALRRSVFKVPETDLDSSDQPEIASLQLVKALARSTREQYPDWVATASTSVSPAHLLAQLAELPQGQTVLTALDEILERYGYLSEVGTDIAVPTWREDPQPVQTLFAQFLTNPPPAAASSAAAATDSEDSSAPRSAPPTGWRYRQVQARLNLKGRVATVYLTLLAELRWSLLALTDREIAQNRLQQPEDGFFLTYNELRASVATPESLSHEALQALVATRRSQFEQHQAQTTVPFIVYGDEPPPTPLTTSPPPPRSGVLQGIGASAGQVQGPVRVLNTLQLSEPIAPGTIIVVPYTDAGWGPILAQAAGLVAEVGGKLSHGAIVAREYQIPAVMNISEATQQFQDGQIVRLDGRAGTVERVTEATTAGSIA
ncbi:MAG: glycerol-3-phosphate acyltransferase [Cyanobacteria bacterium J06626_4]